ncbi:MAG: FAD/NAD(P)-binding protein [candidate division WOR-3 bacterium]|jgi:NAD(P)H-flavin reductase|nr:FAD/NAD(P)-binding protein [candidate division WOR-3 bacterium]MCR4424518.1 FAD/NAD(P)-binding protein [candidate division WOR-3 bacterium]MDH7519634.1 FAD/NAD(P)-binding protein [bacterium]
MGGNPYQPLPVRIERVTVENEARDLKSFDLRFVNQGERERWQFLPGQFAFLSIAGVGEAPFGIASAPDEELLKFTVKRVGAFTTALHEMEEGAIIGLRGPFGSAYPWTLMQGRDVLIVSGGFSFTTLRAVIVHILKKENRPNYGRLVVVYGARTPGELLYKEELRAWKTNPELELVLCADRVCGGELFGFEGANQGEGKDAVQEGLVPEILKGVKIEADKAVALVCGPPIMLRFTHPVLKEMGFKPEQVFLSLENRMKCGIGKCGHCNIGPKYVCKDGPVFCYEELLRLPEDY